MIKKLPGRRARSAASGGGNVVQVQAEIRDGIDKERQRRYQREYKQSQEMEKALEELGDFRFEPVDYSAELTRKQWTEPAIPDFSYILTEARLRIINKYQTSILIQALIGVFFVILSLAFRESFVAIIGIIGFVACIFTLYRDYKNRERDMEKALVEGRRQIDERINEIRESIAKAREEFEETETARIEKIEKLLSGDPLAVFERLEEALNAVRLPFYMRCTIDFYNNEPVLTLHLPDNSVIPPQTVTLNAAGACEYSEKPPQEIARKYLEALAGTAITLGVLLLSQVPSMEALYIRGLFDKWENQECLFGLKLTQDMAMHAPEWHSGIEAFNALKASYTLRENNTLAPVDPVLPAWWEKAPREHIRSTKLICQSRF